MIEIHTTKERKRNASAAGGALAGTNKLLLAGSAAAGGGVSLVVADKAHLSPVMAGVATGGAAMAGSALFKNPTVKDCFFAASLGGLGVAGVQMLATVLTRRQQAANGHQPSKGKRQADAFAMPMSGSGFVTRQELNDALGQLADKNTDQHKQTCDLMTALRDEIKSVVAGEAQTPNATHSPAPTPGGVPRMYPLYPAVRGADVDDERNAYVDDEYMRNAYGVDDEERNWSDTHVGNGYVDDERNADVDDERNWSESGNHPGSAYVDDERNAYVDAGDEG